MPTPRPRSSRSTRKRLITPEDLLHLVGVGDPQIAPDATRVAFVRKHVDAGTNEYVTAIWTADPTGRDAPRRVTFGGKDSQPRFSPDGGRLAFVAGRDRTRPQIWVLDARVGEPRQLTWLPDGSIGAMRWSPDGSKLAAAFRPADPEWTTEAKQRRAASGRSDPPRVLDDWWYRLDGDGYFNAQRHALYVIDAATGAHRRLYARDTMGTFSFDWSPDSREIVVATNRDPRAMVRPWKDELLRVNVARGTIRPVPDLPEGPKHQPRWSPDGRRIAYVGRVGRDGSYSTENLELWVCDPRTGRARSLTGRTDYCLMAVAISDTSEAAFDAHFCWSPDSRRLYLQLGWHGESHIASVRAAGGPVHQHTRGARMHGLGSVSRDGRYMALTVGSATRPDEIHVARIAPRFDPSPVTRFNAPFVRQIALSTPTSHWIASTDGIRVQAWVLEPPAGTRRRKRPAILEIHGGPHAQYGVGFFHEFQCLAAAGYVVVFSNPRGSKGYGRDFCHAIHGQWGGKDWEDVQAVLRFMQADPGIDRDRIGVMGGSYGGYMTNWAIAHTHEFRAAITDRCVSNLVSMGGTSDYVDEPDRYWPGNFWDRPEARWNQSPLHYFGRVRTPTLIIHSEGDLRCNIEQAEQVFAALRLRRVPARFVRYPASTSHGMSRNGPPDLRRHRLRQILDWWERWLQPQRRDGAGRPGH